jgi:hypothetical protein
MERIDALLLLLSLICLFGVVADYVAFAMLDRITQGKRFKR